MSRNTKHTSGDRNGEGAAGPPASIAGTGVSRRSFIQTLGMSAAAGALAGKAHGDGADAPCNEIDEVPIRGPGPIDVALTVNGRRMNAQIEPQTTLMEVLRWQLELTGTKEVCDRGACGACSVLVDGELMASCMMLAVDAEGSEITTIEGISRNVNQADDPTSQTVKLDPLQEAFVRHDAMQCGYCTPGLVVACRALLNEHPRPTLDQIKKGLSGNICRCGTYSNIYNAVLDASGQQPIADAAVARGARP